jgi:hypothetical protein
MHNRSALLFFSASQDPPGSSNRYCLFTRIAHWPNGNMLGFPMPRMKFAPRKWSK